MDDDHLGRGAPGHLRLHLRGVDLDDRVELGARIGDAASASRSRRRSTSRRRRRERAALHVGDGLVVHGDQAGARARLDRHVAHRHAAFHRERADRGAGELDGVAGAAGGADPADHRKHDVLGGARRAAARPRTSRACSSPSSARSVCVASTCSTSLVPMPCASAPKAPCVRGVGVAADHRHAGQRRALLRADHVDDALAQVVHVEVGLPWNLSQLASSVSTCRREIGSAMPSERCGRGDVVVAVATTESDPPQLAPGQLESLERLRARHFVDQVAVDVEQRRAVGFFADEVGGPELVVERARRHGSTEAKVKL